MTISTALMMLIASAIFYALGYWAGMDRDKHSIRNKMVTAYAMGYADGEHLATPQFDYNPFGAIKINLNRCMERILEKLLLAHGKNLKQIREILDKELKSGAITLPALPSGTLASGAVYPTAEDSVLYEIDTSDKDNGHLVLWFRRASDGNESNAHLRAK